MKKKLLITLASIASVGAIGVAGLSVANADSSTGSGNVGTSGIPRSVFRQDKLDAAAQVLNTTAANVSSAIQNKTLHTLISNAGFTRKTFETKVKAQLTTELEDAGYTQDQITIALQHRAIIRLHRRLHE